MATNTTKISLTLDAPQNFVDAINRLAEAVEILNKGVGAAPIMQPTPVNVEHIPADNIFAGTVVETPATPVSPVQAAPVATATPVAPATPVTPVQAAPVVPVTPATPIAPVQVANQQPFTVPVAATPSITVDQIMQAGAYLASRGHNMAAVLASYGVNAVTDLNQQQIEMLANQMRQMGANI